KLATFARLANQSWFLAGEEDLDFEAQETIQEALRTLGVMTSDGRFGEPNWWVQLPFDDLTEIQRQDLQLEIYQQFILLSVTRMRSWGTKITAGKDLSTPLILIGALMNPPPRVAAGFQSALEPLIQARIMEEKKLAPSTMARFLLTWEYDRLIK